jgi:hypothetical protein
VSVVEKYLAGIIAIGMATTLILPKRQTAQVIGATGSAASNLLKTAQGR